MGASATFVMGLTSLCLGTTWHLVDSGQGDTGQRSLLYLETEAQRQYWLERGHAQRTLKRPLGCGPKAEDAET